MFHAFATIWDSAYLKGKKKQKKKKKNPQGSEGCSCNLHRFLEQQNRIYLHCVFM